MKRLCGWTGKIAQVDLTERKISILDTQDYSPRFIGGIGIGQKIYWDQQAASPLDAFDSANPLILMTGPLAGTSAPSAPRLSVSGKSPCIYPETYAHASIAGFFPAELKMAGYDGMVITGRADKPVSISITHEDIQIRDAAHMWGLSNSKTRDILRKELGEKVRILSIGPGGENPTRIGIIFGDVAGSASMGFGSVMGSKNLKAIAVRGTRTIPVAEPEKIKSIRTSLRQMTGEGYFNLFGTPITLGGTQVVKKAHCHGCPQGCWRSLQRDVSGFEDIRKCQTGMFYSLWDRKLHGKPTEASFQAATMANDYSLCVIELAMLLLWLDRCIDGGALTEKDIELPLAGMGSLEFLEALCKKICLREGFGQVLAQGVMRAAEIVGGAAQAIAGNFLSLTGRGIAYGPKVFMQSALIYATEPRPSITELHEICEPLTKWGLWYTSQGEKSYVSTAVLRAIGKKFWGSELAVDFSTYEGKARASQLIQNRQYAKESLILCDFAWPVYDAVSTADHAGDPALESRLLSAVTGEDVDEKELDHKAERIFTLNRAILLREGRKGKEEDILPEFFFLERDEFIADVFGMYNPQLLLPGSGDEVISRRGKAVDREKFAQMRDEYYRLRGWDVKTGFLKKETLGALNLNELIEPLKDKAV
ncbi:MAG: aldehyde ferredoxin oxidoreductase N-terminal domain-containing protein [Pseudomonadota bacterium]